MPGSPKDWIGLTILTALAIVLIAIGAAAVFYCGFGWSIVITVGIGALIYRFIPIGPYGEGSFVITGSWILLAIGLAVGLALRLVLRLVTL